MQHSHHSASMPTEFPTDPSGLPEATQPRLLELAGGDVLDLEVGPVAKRLGDTTVRMLGYNGSIPGPTLRVQQGSEIIVNVTNRGDLPRFTESTQHRPLGARVGDRSASRQEFSSRGSCGVCC
jgi:hypothetical protein